MTIYREILAKRRDMTEWLIHFTRNVDGRSGKESFLSILTGGVLRPTFAHRGNPSRPTIYGMHPAVCFTEQPISAFLDYLEVRTKQNEMSGYGIFLHKNDLFAIGGLPVIYGLPAATELAKDDKGYMADRRLLLDSDINSSHQYRYSAFAPTREGDPLDWSHEREWRWPARHVRREGEPLGLLLGQPSFSGRGNFECRVHAFVDKDEDIPWIQEQLRSALDNETLGQGDDAPGKKYGALWKIALQDVRVISLETARQQLSEGTREYERFDTWPVEKAPALAG